MRRTRHFIPLLCLLIAVLYPVKIEALGNENFIVQTIMDDDNAKQLRRNSGLCFVRREILDVQNNRAFYLDIYRKTPKSCHLDKYFESVSNLQTKLSTPFINGIAEAKMRFVQTYKFMGSKFFVAGYDLQATVHKIPGYVVYNIHTPLAKIKGATPLNPQETAVIYMPGEAPRYRSFFLTWE